MTKYRTYDSGEAFGKKGSWAGYFKGEQGLLPDMEFTLEGFLDRTAGLIDQAPHMLPSLLGQGIVTASTVATVASGGTATLPGHTQRVLSLSRYLPEISAGSPR